MNDIYGTEPSSQTSNSRQTPAGAQGVILLRPEVLPLLQVVLELILSGHRGLAKLRSRNIGFVVRGIKAGSDPTARAHPR
jgi:hypothetical protein